MPWFDDIEIGTRRELGAHLFTAEEIIAFATQYDPQPFHVDLEAAAKGPFGGLVASGWHTAAIWMKMMTIAQFAAKDDGTPPAGPSPGFFDLRWPVPVRPGDTIRFSTTVIEKIAPKSRPQWGIVRNLGEGINQNGVLVYSFVGQGIMTRRTPGTGEGS